jgi:hypothetical protein
MAVQQAERSAAVYCVLTLLYAAALLCLAGKMYGM